MECCHGVLLLFMLKTVSSKVRHAAEYKTPRQTKKIFFSSTSSPHLSTLLELGHTWNLDPRRASLSEGMFHLGTQLLCRLPNRTGQSNDFNCLGPAHRVRVTTLSVKVLRTLGMSTISLYFSNVFKEYFSSFYRLRNL